MTNKITGVGRCLLLTLWESASTEKGVAFHGGISGLVSLVSIRVRDRVKWPLWWGYLRLGKGFGIICGFFNEISTTEICG